MPPNAHGDVLELLQATPRRIIALVEGRSGEELARKPSPDSWSVNDVLVHLRACADVWGGSILTMLAQRNPAIRYLSPRTWLRNNPYPETEFHPSFAAYSASRERLLEVLRGLPPDGWLRGASVRASTQVRRETVFTYAGRIARHEAVHCEQIARILGSGMAGSPR